jgi:hypothetical protein
MYAKFVTDSRKSVCPDFEINSAINTTFRCFSQNISLTNTVLFVYLENCFYVCDAYETIE